MGVRKFAGAASLILVIVSIVSLAFNSLEFGLDFAAEGSFSPWLTIWFPTLIFIIVTSRLYYIGAHQVGGVPLRNLEIISDVITEAVKKMFSRLRTAS